MASAGCAASRCALSLRSLNALDAISTHELQSLVGENFLRIGRNLSAERLESKRSRLNPLMLYFDAQNEPHRTGEVK